MTEADRAVIDQFRAARIVVGGSNPRVDAALANAYDRLCELVGTDQ